ncbi:MAG: 2-hydroxyacid dehydrogenase [Bacteroidota bacterium]|nr:2-hydroxyacid dehydrogenase [Bacteroidota bacterium]
MRIAVYSTHQFDKPYLTTAAVKHELIFIDQELTESNVHLAESCDAVALFTSDHALAEVLEKLSKLNIKYIVLRSAGFDHVDLQKAKELGLKVANVPAYSPYAVAEHAVALLMALNRKLRSAHDLMKKQDFRLDGLTGFDVHGKTVGIIGLGKIGEAFARIMNGFGCKLLCFDPHPNYALEKELNIKFVLLSELCVEADIISIHCPLNKETKHLFNRNLFDQMKKGVYLINTARGPIINTTDLIIALNNGIVGAAGLDVYEFEKGLFFKDHRHDQIKDTIFNELMTLPNVLITGHQAFLTTTALQNIADTTINNLNCFEEGVECPNQLYVTDH